MKYKLTTSQEYFVEQIIEGIHNSFQRDLNLSIEEENALEGELRARVWNYLNN